jgi:hypothetical protein
MDTNKIRTTDAHRAYVLGLLNLRLPEDQKGIEKALRDTEGCYIHTVTDRVKAQRELFKKREHMRHPKDPTYTDMDRKIMLDAHTAEEQATYEELVGIEKALEQRISVIQALLVQ